jgi:hypothetical protein
MPWESGLGTTLETPRASPRRSLARLELQSRICDRVPRLQITSSGAGNQQRLLIDGCLSPFPAIASKFHVSAFPISIHNQALTRPPLETSWRRVSRSRVQLPNLDRRLTGSSLERPRMDICTALWTHGFFKKDLLRHISMPSLLSRSRFQTPLQSLFDLLSLSLCCASCSPISNPGG